MESRTCPHCHHKLSLRECSIYLYKDAKHSIQCGNCKREIRPIKDPIRFEYCVSLGFLCTYIPAMISIHIFHTDFITAALWAIPFVSILVIIITIIIFKKLFFK